MSTISRTPATTSAPETRSGWLAVSAVTIAIFAIVTAEILPVGLLTAIGADFTVSDGNAGLMMAAPGLVAAVAAPVVTTATARIDRRIILCLCMFLLVAANVLMVAAPAYPLVLVSRVLVGITIGGFWSIAAGLATRLVPAAAAARANAVIFAAVPLGSVLGVPAGTLLGEIAGWRATFAALGVVTAVVLGMLVAFVPPLPAHRATDTAVLGTLLRGTTLRFALLTTVLVVFAHFGTYTYVTPFLEQVTRLDPGPITLVLLSYGTAGILGNFLGGAAIVRYPHATFAGAAAVIALATLLLPILGHTLPGALGLLVVWGIGYGAVPVSAQTWFAEAAPAAPEAAAVLFTAAFQASFALGALTGGAVVDRSSPGTVLLLGGLIAAFVLAPVTAHARRRAGVAPAPLPRG